jgi:uncharacterized protein YjiS (DUF1127 family)
VRTNAAAWLDCSSAGGSSAVQYQILCSAAKARTGVFAMALIHLIISARRAFSEWRRREQAYAELMALDDHSLADIGIHRSQIGALVEGVRMPELSSPPILFPDREKFGQRKAA